MMIPDPLLDIAQSTAPVTVPILLLLGAVLHYARTGSLPLGRIPFRAIKRSVRELGDTYAARARPTTVPGLVVTATVEEVESALRARGWESVDLYSYQYEGEVLNLRRPAGKRLDRATGETLVMEAHVRAFDLDGGGLWLIAHTEPSRFEEPGAHLRETMMSWDGGRDVVVRAFAGDSFAPVRVDSEQELDSEVLP